MVVWKAYLVEQYRPGVTVEALARTALHVRAAAETLEREGRALRYLRSTILPTDEALLSLFEASSEDLVREAYSRSGEGFERISRAIVPDDRPEALEGVTVA